MSNLRSYYACLFSVRWLFRDIGFRDLDSEKVPERCRLWTFTLPTEELRRNARRCVAMFNRMSKSRFFKGGRGGIKPKQYVHVLEMSEGGYWHIHVVTAEWWDVNEVRECAEFHGFGRINVRAIPVKDATYVCKYLMKCRRVPTGCRKWACHGFEGVGSREINIKECVANVVEWVYDGHLWEKVCYNLGDNGHVTFPLREVSLPGSPETKMIEIKAAAQKAVLTEAVSGFVCVGEYRSSRTRTLKVSKKGGGGEEDRVIVEHSIEVGGRSHVFSEWLPPGASAVAVKPVAKQGDCVLAVINKLSAQYGAGLDRLVVL